MRIRHNSAVPMVLSASVYPCFATRWGGVSGGKENQGWRVSSQDRNERSSRCRFRLSAPTA